jgi:hypothetical protein
MDRISSVRIERSVPDEAAFVAGGHRRLTRRRLSCGLRGIEEPILRDRDTLALVKDARIAAAADEASGHHRFVSPSGLLWSSAQRISIEGLLETALF